MAIPSKFIWTIFLTEIQFGNKVLTETVLKKVENFEGKRTEMFP